MMYVQVVVWTTKWGHVIFFKSTTWIRDAHYQMVYPRLAIYYVKQQASTILEWFCKRYFMKWNQGLLHPDSD